ncbi:FAD-dependent oxidoreductase [Microbacterium sp. EYE_5]|uniref:FAD-dependent oxidoreductase n=1 Tax=unclassified Microbacterium TaxID=2609290 RepID=UPI002005348C|nr:MULTISPECIES: FAD-dependent oxidoreductase [unclassified Microbacterium]MCK6080323.1 FAD-dependent oxidoreductase [Microbacterium sp. EYE_382]MCK6085594.1 FAD-dependent oxidoreductase [Microbacterium sp. EYE_384]MCK6122181.1 FAD-dependent oxidoreductase [Microbacterium sp. EYE_80]MCK6126357.1 FAD-dependent oxidoreductase [Microbacterium sp. EYE_79]MCK6141278.1 FAD-dependent oxidoreductase [Microbacterium sp. EYE_39]
MSASLVDVAVIGAGQAGLSAAHHLRRRGFVPASSGEDGPTFVVLDAEDRAGGAWQHRWATLRMGTVNGIHELPGHPVPPADPAAPSREVLPAYFDEYERLQDLRVHRPVRVRSVRREDDDAGGRLLVTAETPDGAASWRARYVVNATGTWRRPFWPHYPGQERFAGVQLHVHDYVAADAFAGRRVVVVGAGVSAIQLLDEISAVTDTFWVSRAEPKWDADAFDTAARIQAIAGVEERVRRGLPPGSVVSVTGAHWSPWAQAAQDRGALVWHPMFTAVEPTGVRMPDGTLEPADAILWATGFRADIAHLSPLGLRTEAGGIRVRNTRAIDEPRLFLIGYGPSQSTIGANRAGRDAVRAIVAAMRETGSA